MKIVEAIQKDEEIKTLKREYKEKYHKNAPPYNYDQFKGLDDYKAYLRKQLENNAKKGVIYELSIRQQKKCAGAKKSFIKICDSSLKTRRNSTVSIST